MILHNKKSREEYAQKNRPISSLAANIPLNIRTYICNYSAVSLLNIVLFIIPAHYYNLKTKNYKNYGIFNSQNCIFFLQ